MFSVRCYKLLFLQVEEIILRKEMPHTCLVVKCGSRSNRDPVSFFSVPAILKFKHRLDLNKLSLQRRERWIAAIKRNDLKESYLINQKVCSKHFITGKPATLEDVDHPDWVPSQDMGHSAGAVMKKVCDVTRMERLDRRKRKKIDESCDPSSSADQIVEVHENVHEESGTNNKGVQTDLVMEDLCRAMQNLSFASEKLDALENQIQEQRFTLQTFTENDSKCKYYTGLTFPILETLFDHVQEFIPYHNNTSLSRSSQLIMTLMKLRLNLDFKDLAFRFNICNSTASNYFETVIEVLYQRLKCFIVWPDREILKQNVPSCFKEVFGDKVTVIIDCFEVFIQKPANLLTYAQCWSNYKHHTTVKFLIGITPQGTICFISDTWGGRISDKQITEQSNFLYFIGPNDVVIADRGFLINNDLSIRQAKLVIPAFTRGKKQFHPVEIEETRSVAHVRIHVERAIGVLKNKF